MAKFVLFASSSGPSGWLIRGRKHLNSGWLCVVFLNFSPGTWMIDIHPCPRTLPGVACDGYPCIQHFITLSHSDLNSNIRRINCIETRKVGPFLSHPQKIRQTKRGCNMEGNMCRVASTCLPGEALVADYGLFCQAAKLG